MSSLLQRKLPTQFFGGGSHSKVSELLPKTHNMIKTSHYYASVCTDIYTFLLYLVGKHSAQWALDDVLIGMNDSSRTGFHDKFDGMTPLRHNWYRIQGGEVTVDCLSLDTALTFNSEAIDSK